MGEVLTRTERLSHGSILKFVRHQLSVSWCLACLLDFDCALWLPLDCCTRPARVPGCFFWVQDFLKRSSTSEPSGCAWDQSYGNIEGTLPRAGLTSAICSQWNAADLAPCSAFSPRGRFFGDLWAPFMFTLFNGGDFCRPPVAPGWGRGGRRPPPMPTLIAYSAARGLLVVGLVFCNVVTPSPWQLPVLLRCGWRSYARIPEPMCLFFGRLKHAGTVP